MGLLETIAGGVRIFDLGHPLQAGVPHSPSHPSFCQALVQRHEDAVRVDGGSSAVDIIVTGTHVGTHIDALAHIAQDGCLHGGVAAREAMAGGKFPSHGIHATPPLVARGLLLDVGGVVGDGRCSAAYEVTVADLETTSKAHGVQIRAGDIVLVRTGWGANWDDGAAYLGVESGVPGIGAEAAEWLARAGVRAVGSDTSALEVLPPGRKHGNTKLPVHRILLVENQVNIIESLSLDEIAAAEVHQFLFVGAHINLVGATGAPLRPLALADLASAHE